MTPNTIIDIIREIAHTIGWMVTAEWNYNNNEFYGLPIINIKHQNTTISIIIYNETIILRMPITDKVTNRTYQQYVGAYDITDPTSLDQIETILKNQYKTATINGKPTKAETINA